MTEEHQEDHQEDRLDGLREDLEQVPDVPLADHPELFDRIHRALVAELNALEEV